MAELFKYGDYKEFNYTGNIQSIELLPGTYKLECYGAQGGDATGGYVGGKGGYHTGTIRITSTTTLYVCVGGKGACTNNSAIMSAGGYNGGGNGKYNSSSPQYVGAGGGATSITTTNRGILKNFINNKSEIVLVAGGGGGANWWQGQQAANGGAGGGINGSTGANAGHTPGTGGTQSAGGTGGASGSFGQGGFGQSISVGSAGGGGGYYGGGASYDNAGGGGGSGYAASSLTNVSYSNGSRSGNGYAKITCINVGLTFVGATARFNYTGSEQYIDLLPGKYKLEAWGASGGIGNGNINPIGLGGYTSGELVVINTTRLYLHVGQDGVSNAYTSVRYNGGGAAVGTSGHNGGAGGGATDFRIKSGAWNDSESLKSRILVAGGGGGAQPSCGNKATAGHGGGLIGGTSYNQGYQGYAPATAATRAYSTGGTQTAGGYGYNINDNNTTQVRSGSFGAGANSVTCGAGGGGGWYGCATGYTSGGGGGSSYAAGWEGCNTQYRAEQSNMTFENVVMTQGVNTGNGYAIITCLSLGYTITYSKKNGISNIETNFEENNLLQEGEKITLKAILSPGYDFSHWSGTYNSNDITFTFIMPANNVNLVANATPRDDTKYKVNHHLRNLDNTYKLKDVIQYEGTTDTKVTPPVNTYTGFTSPALKSVNINGDGSTVIDYYYQRTKYILTLLNGISKKYEYLFEELGNIQYDKMDDATYTFDYWNSEQNVDIDNIWKRQTSFKMPAYDITIFAVGKLNRLNTNIYKNIFPEEVFNMDFINESLDDLPETTDDIKQRGHGLSTGNVVYLDSDGLYKKALAENSKRAFPIGVVSGVSNSNVFTLIKTGKMQSSIKYNYEDTSILYLSDVTPGKLVHYQEIQNDIYIPVAVYTNQGIIVNIQEGSMGGKLIEYGAIQGEDIFESYTEDELNEVITQIKDGVLDAE